MKGLKGTTFEIEFTQGWPQEGDLLDFGERNHDLKLKVLSTPRIKNNKWWQRLINLITFNRFYKRSYFYIVERV